MERTLREQIGSDSEQEEENMEEDQEAEEEEVEPAVEQARGFTPFSGTGYRLG